MRKLDPAYRESHCRARHLPHVNLMTAVIDQMVQWDLRQATLRTLIAQVTSALPHLVHLAHLHREWLRRSHRRRKPQVRTTRTQHAWL